MTMALMTILSLRILHINCFLMLLKFLSAGRIRSMESGIKRAKTESVRNLYGRKGFNEKE